MASSKLRMTSPFWGAHMSTGPEDWTRPTRQRIVSASWGVGTCTGLAMHPGAITGPSHCKIVWAAALSQIPLFTPLPWAWLPSVHACLSTSRRGRVEAHYHIDGEIKAPDGKHRTPSWWCCHAGRGWGQRQVGEMGQG